MTQTRAQLMEWFLDGSLWRRIRDREVLASDEARKIACLDAECGYLYARDIDKMPRDDTRKAACKDFRWAYDYAYWVDKRPRDDTRMAACKDSLYKVIYKTWETYWGNHDWRNYDM